MKHEPILACAEWPPREPRVAVDFDIEVHSNEGSVAAQILNLSADGFRLHTAKPLSAGSEVTLEAAKQFPVKALICWACGLESGGVFSDSITL